MSSPGDSRGSQTSRAGGIQPTPVRQPRGALWRFILALGLGILVGLACAAAAWLFIPNVYEASALLEVAESQPSIIGDDARDDFRTYKRAQAVLIKDPFILRAALLDPEIAKLSLIQDHKRDPERWLSDHLIVEYPGDATLMRISLRGSRPDELAKIVVAVTNAYLNEGLNRERTTRARERDVLEQSLQDYQNRVRELRRSIHETSKKLGVTSSEAAAVKKAVMLDQFTTLLQERAAKVHEIRELKRALTRLQYASKSQEDKATDLDVVLEISQDQQIVRLEEDVARLKQVEFDESLRGPNPIASKDLKQKVAKLEEAIDDRKAQLKPLIYEKVKLESDNQSKIALAKLRLEELEKALEEDNTAIKKIVGDVETIDKHSGDLIALQNELDALTRVANQMDQKHRMWEVNKSASPRVSLVREATVSAASAPTPEKLLITAAAGIVGFCLTVICVALSGRRQGQGT